MCEWLAPGVFHRDHDLANDLVQGEVSIHPVIELQSDERSLTSRQVRDAACQFRGAQLQADIRVRVNNDRRPAPDPPPQSHEALKLTGSVSNLPGSEMALVALQFDYRVNADFALDEIISQIVISVEYARAKSAFTR